jgi:hypothetical protein
MYKISLRAAMRASVLAIAVAAGIGSAGPASASDPTYNHAVVNIHGGNGAAFADCLNTARRFAQYNRRPPTQYCQSFAEAEGGDVSLEHVSIFIDQEGHRTRTENNATVNIHGGDATGRAACLNYLQGTATSGQRQQCAATAVVTGGSVDLTNVDITIIQTGG